ncbi:MAG: ABC transporter ATP-binding protein/permease [Planctomycetota bacterium]|nr:ABC transporter ATP-binding protein/permease [Planctomycetota bacterium]
MFLRLLGLLKPYRAPIVAGFACLVLMIPCQLFHPLVWKFVVDEVLIAGHREYLLPALGVMLGVFLLGTGLSAARTYLLGRAGQRFVNDLRARLHGKLMRQSLAYHHERRSGDMQARVVGDVDVLNEVVINGVDTILTNALGFVGVAGIVLWLNWKVGVLTLIPLALVAAMVWYFNLKVKGLYRRVRDRLGDLSALLQEHLAGIAVIKAFAREPHEGERFEERNAAYYSESLKGVRARSFYFPGVMAVGFFSNVAMLGAGAYFVYRGEFTIGGLVALRGYWWQLFSPVQSLAQINEMIQRAGASAGRLFDVLDAPETVRDAPDAKELPSFEGRLVFERVGFAYTSDRPALKGVDFEVRPGQTFGVVGPSGSGKSTVLNLILRFYDPQDGAVRLDGHDLRELKQAALRRHTAIVTQEPFLFNATIRENILFGRLGARDEELQEAARQANAHEFIEALPRGYETLVGERGVKLSGGQKQRLCIARAFLANPRLLLLDEATASVEPESEALIQAALERLMRGRTTVIVSHRLSLVRNCDRILAIRDGRIAERGSHDELLAQGGWYARMYKLQSEGAGFAELEQAAEQV